MNKEEKYAREIAWKHFISIGAIPPDAVRKDWVLHHKDTSLKYTNPIRYREWRIEDLIPMPIGEHTILHMQLGDNKPYWEGKSFSEEHKKRISESEKGKTVSEESKKKIAEWRKGKHIQIIDGKRRYV